MDPVEPEPASQPPSGGQYSPESLAATRLEASATRGDAYGPPESMVAHAPQKIGRYHILRKLGEGGMGVVYAAYDETLDRKVALKLVRGGSSRPETRMRVLREARALAKLNHPNVVQIYEVDEWQGDVYIAMELIRGSTLDVWCEGRSWQEILATYREAGDGLAAAHAADIVHRDFKPQNCLVGEDMRVRVLDFGLARAATPADVQTDALPQVERARSDLGEQHPLTSSHPSTAAPVTRPDPTQTDLTATGAVMGTPAYMSPEQHLGEVADAASDQFSFCVALYEALYGERPFPGDGVMALRFNVIQGALRDAPRDTKVPSWLRAAVVRGLTVEHEDRHPDMGSLLQILAHDPAAARRRKQGFAGVALTSIALAVGLSQFRADAPSATGPTCPTVESHREDIYPQARASALRRHLEQGGQSWAPDLAHRVDSRMAAYAHEWAEARTQSCVDTRIRPVQSGELFDLQIACLDRHRRAFDALLASWKNIKEENVVAAVSAINRLPLIATCSDAAALRAAVPLPDDPVAAARVEEAYNALVATRVQIAANDREAAQSTLSAVGEVVDATKFERLRGEWLEARAKLAELEGHYDVALELMESAYYSALASGHEALASRGSLALVAIIDGRLRKPEASGAWLRTAQALVPRQPTSSLDHLALLYSKARRRDISDSQRGLLYEQALALALTHPHGRDRYLSTLNEFAAFKLGQGEFGEAGELWTKAMEQSAEDLGPAHPRALVMRLNLATAYMRAGNWARAASELDTVGEGWKASLPEDHPYFRALFNNQGQCLLELGDLAGAEVAVREGLIRAQRKWPQGHQSVASSEFALAQVLLAQGAIENAQQHYDRADALWVEHGSYREGRIDLLIGRGRVRIAAGRAALAVPFLESAIQLRSEHDGESDWRQGYALAYLADALAKDAPAKARVHAQLALERLGSGFPTKVELAQAQVIAAELNASQDPAEALRLVEEADAVLRTASISHEPYALRARTMIERLRAAK